MSIDTYNNITRRRRNQQNFKDIFPLSIIKDDIEEYFSLLTKSQQRVFSFLWNLYRKFGILYVSQSKIANKCFITREYVNKILSKFEEDGLIALHYRHKKTSLCRISSFFTDKVWSTISYIFRTWQVFNLSLLLSNPAPIAVLEKSSHNINKEFIYIINNINNKLINTNSLKKEEKIMQALYNENIIPYWRELKSVRPTIWGQVYLSAFPEEVVLHADKVTLNCKKNLATNLDRWRYLLSVCKSYCKDNDIETSWPQAFDTGKELGMPNDGPFFDDSFIPVKDIVINSPKRVGGKSFAKQSVSSSVSWEEAIRSNRQLTEMYNKRLADTLPPVEEIIASRLKFESLSQEEQECVRKEKIARKLSDEVKNSPSAREFRRILGLNEDGTFQAGSTPEQAIKILANSLK